MSTCSEAISDDEGEVFLDDSDIIDEFMLDDEDLSDFDDDDEVASEEMSTFSEPDESLHMFRGHTEMSDPELDDSVHTFRGHTEPLFAVACSPTDSTLVASGSLDDKEKKKAAFLWRINQGDWQKELVGHENTISRLAFSYDGQLLASGGVDAYVKIWDMSGNLKCTFGGTAEGSEDEVEWVRWHPRGHLVLAGYNEGAIWLWDADKGAPLCEFRCHSGPVTCGDFTPDGKTICTGGEDGTLRKWNPRSGEGTLVEGYSYKTSPLTCLTFTWDSTLALTGDNNGCLAVANLAQDKVVCSIPSHSKRIRIRCIGISSSVPWVATGGADGKLVIWDLQHSASHSICENEKLLEQQVEVTCLKWLGESRCVATGYDDGQIIIWDTRSGQSAMSLRGHSQEIHELSLSANRDFLVSASEDGTARVFCLSNFR